MDFSWTEDQLKYKHAVIAFAQKEFTLKGTMKHTDIEGGCWYLETARGKKYALIGSEEHLHLEPTDMRPLARRPIDLGVRQS